MSTLAGEFKSAYTAGSGDALAAVFTPIGTQNKPYRLQSFYDFTNAASLQKDLSFALFHGKSLKLPRAEQTAWVDIFAAYWEAVGRC